MPVIREYRSQVRAPGVINQSAYSGDQFGASQGKALETAGTAVQTVAEVAAKRLDQQNTSDVTAKLTKANADLAIELQNTIRTAQPGDKQPFEDFQKKADDTIGAIGDEASTASARVFFAENAAKVKGQLAKVSADGQAELAGVKAVTDYTQTSNSLTSAAMVDPSSLSLQRDLHKAAIENLVNTGGLPRDKAIQLQARGDEQLSKAALRGWANLNPDYAKQKLASGEFDSTLGADGKAQMQGEIDQAIRAKEIDAERQAREQEKIKKAAEQKTQNTFLTKLVDGSLSTKDILNSNLEAFGSGSKEQFLQLAKTRNSPEEKLKTDPATMISLYQRIHLPDTDPNKLRDENELNQYFGNGLSMTDLGHLRGEIQGKGTEAGEVESQLKKQVIDIAKGKLTKSNPLTGFRDPIGDEQLQRFMVNFFSDYPTKRAAGKTPQDLLTPGSPDYLGKNIDQYVRTPQQIMRDMVPKRAPVDNLTNVTQPADTYKAPPPAAPNPRKPGESADAYLKRIKGGS